MKKLKNITCLDIGQNYLVRLYNTCLFYKNNKIGEISRGNLNLAKRLKFYIPKDKVLSVGSSPVGKN